MKIKPNLRIVGGKDCAAAKGEDEEARLLKPFLRREPLFESPQKGGASESDLEVYSGIAKRYFESRRRVDGEGDA